MELEIYLLCCLTVQVLSKGLPVALSHDKINHNTVYKENDPVTDDPTSVCWHFMSSESLGYLSLHVTYSVLQQSSTNLVSLKGCR